MKITCHKTAKILFITIIATSLFNCSSNRLRPDNVRATDHRTVSYDVKLALQPADSRIGFVVASQGVNGKDEQYFPEKTYYDSTLGSDQVRSEATMQDDFSLISNSIALKWNVLIDKHIGINMYFHALNVTADVDVEQPNGKKDHLKESDSGIAPQLEIYVPLNEKLRVVGTLSNLVHDDVQFETESLGLEYSVNKNIAVNISYKKWLYDYQSPNFNYAQNVPGKFNFNDTSDIRLKAQSLSLGVAFSF